MAGMIRCPMVWLFVFTLALASGGCKNAKETAPPRPTVKLHDAIGTNNIEQIKSNLYWGCDVNERGEFGLTPLHLAALGNNAEVVKLLLAKGANFRITSSSGYTPLHEVQGEEVARILLDAGADVNTKTDDGKTPYMLAIEQKNDRLAKFLKSKGGK
jgi:ankyrin repeat protein